VVQSLASNKIVDVGAFEKLKIWQVVYRLNWDYPKTIAHAAAAELGVKYDTKFGDLTLDQKVKLMGLIIEKGQALKL
jgi:hypothetical protein